MKLITRKTFLLTLIALLLVIAAGPLTAQVYKTVDEEGNVTYTDQAPKDGSPPITLREISVVEAPTYEKASRPAGENAEDDDGKEVSLRYLRKNYKDFAIVAPRSEESIWNPGNVITITWNVRYQLQPGMQVTVLVNGMQQAATTERTISVSGLDRGEHTVTAELKDAKGRGIATAQPVTFFIRQPSIYMNTPR